MTTDPAITFLVGMAVGYALGMLVWQGWEVIVERRKKRNEKR